MLAAFAATSNQAFAAESCGISLSLLKSRFETGEQPQYAEVPTENTPLSVTVDYPLRVNIDPNRSFSFFSINNRAD